MRSNLLTAVLAATLSTGASASDFQVLHTFRIGGDGAWDYLTYDSVGQRLFISRADHVQVVDPIDGKLVGDIADTPGVHGIALANDLGKGYVSNGRANSVTVFSTVDLRTIVKVSSGGENPDYIAYDEATKQVVAFNGRSHSAGVIDAALDRLVATIPLAGKPEAAASDGAGRMFVNIENRNQIAVIDLNSRAVIATWPLPGCDEPSGLAIDRVHHRLFAGCHNETMLVIDSTNGRGVASLPIGRGVDANAFDPGAMVAFSSQGDGSLTVVQEEAPERFSVRQNLATQEGARTMALDIDHHRVYLVTADFEPAAPDASGERRRGKVKPGSFRLLVVGEVK